MLKCLNLHDSSCKEALKINLGLLLIMKKAKISNFVGTYIDLFAGCGGLSLGLGNAGWKGLFAVEKDKMAFRTFKHNLIDGKKYGHFAWPEWLPVRSMTIQTLLKNFSEEMAKLQGKVDLIAGGPPCQGFSLAGQRNSSDPRNKLSNEYIKVVELIKPKYVLIENVRGFTQAFSKSKNKVPHAQIVKQKLEKLDYITYHQLVSCEKFGVPQQRTRFILIGIRKDICSNKEESPFTLLDKLRGDFLKRKKLSIKGVSVSEAISDLELSNNTSLINYIGESPNGFKQIQYNPVKKLTSYQKLMRKGLNGVAPNSMRLARHKVKTLENFREIRKVARPGIVLSKEEKEKLGIKKQAICVLHPELPSKTLTTLPDDLLHYKEDRILTVRESARIQSFPDDFEFLGKYTTGGAERTKECPRYTQVGNAVPPLLGELLGELIKVRK